MGMLKTGSPDPDGAPFGNNPGAQGGYLPLAERGMGGGLAGGRGVDKEEVPTY